LDRSGCGEIVKAVLQSMLGEEPKVLSDPSRRHSSAEGVVDAAETGSFSSRELVLER
jgi:hypothetical protein